MVHWTIDLLETVWRKILSYIRSWYNLQETKLSLVIIYEACIHLMSVFCDPMWRLWPHKIKPHYVSIYEPCICFSAAFCIIQIDDGWLDDHVLMTCQPVIMIYNPITQRLSGVQFLVIIQGCHLNYNKLHTR